MSSAVICGYYVMSYEHNIGISFICVRSVMCSLAVIRRVILSRRVRRNDLMNKKKKRVEQT